MIKVTSGASTSTTTTSTMTASERAAALKAKLEAQRAAAPAKAPTATPTATGGKKFNITDLASATPRRGRLREDPEVLRKRQIADRIAALPSLNDGEKSLVDGYLNLSPEARVKVDLWMKAGLAAAAPEERYADKPSWLVPGARVKFVAEKPNLIGRFGTVRKVGRFRAVCSVDGMKTEGYVVFSSILPLTLNGEGEEVVDEETLQLEAGELQASASSAPAQTVTAEVDDAGDVTPEVIDDLVEASKDEAPEESGSEEKPEAEAV